jgi:hypothetical protein
MNVSPGVVAGIVPMILPLFYIMKGVAILGWLLLHLVVGAYG